MKLVIQRVREAKVEIEGKLISEIRTGLLVLVGVDIDDTPTDADWLAAKTASMRIFPDEEGVMNRSVMDVAGGVLAVSQFTLLASTKKGNRPSYIRAARPEKSIPLYDYYCEKLSEILHRDVLKGVFGADMQVSLLNDGPVTIIIDSRNKS